MNSLSIRIPFPDASTRARMAADRSVGLDPSCQQGWRQLAMRSHFDRDLARDCAWRPNGRLSSIR